jgi:hypothetical protein
MNKRERFLKGKYKQISRIKKHCINLNGDLPIKYIYRLKTTGTPCSCAMCSPGKIVAKGTKKREYKELQFQLVA